MAENTGLPASSDPDGVKKNPAPLSGSSSDSTGAGKIPLPKKKSHKWLKRIVIGVVVVLLLLVGLVAFAPMIVSTAPARAFLVGKVNDNLNGKVEIGEMSVSWTGGLHVGKVKVLDANGAEIAELASFSSELSLIDAIKGKYHLGKTVIDGLDLNIKRDKDGRLNFQNLAKASSTPTPAGGTQSTASTGTVKVPDVTGELVITNSRATIDDQQLGQSFFLTSISGDVKIPDINQTITDTLEIACKGTSGQSGNLKIDGTVANAFNNNELALNAVKVNQTVALSQFDLGILSPVLKALKQEIDPSGIASGNLVIAADSVDKTTNLPANLSVDGQLGIARCVVAGGILKGDRFDAGDLQLPIKLSRVTTSGAAKIKVDVLAVKMKQGNVDVHVDAPEEALKQAAAFLPAVMKQALAGGPSSQQIALSGGAGSAAVAVHLDLADIVRQLPNTLNFYKGTVINTGKLDHTTSITFSPDKAVIASDTRASLSATVNGKPVDVPDFSAALGATAVGGTKPDLSDLKLAVNSSFLKLNAQGQSLAQASIDGSFDLADLQSRLGFIDFGTVQLRGTGQFALSSKGDLTKTNGQLATTAGLQIKDLVISGMKDRPPIQESHIVFNYSGDALRGEQQFLKQINNAVISIQAGNSTSPTIDMHGTGDITMDSQLGPDGKPAMVVKAPKFDLDKLNVNLAQLLTEAQPVLAMLDKPTTAPAIAQIAGTAAPTTSPSMIAQLHDKTLTVPTGTLSLAMGGSYDGTTLNLSTPLVLSIQQLSLIRTNAQGTKALLNNDSADVRVAGKIGLLADATTIDLSTLSVTGSNDLVKLSKSDGRNFSVTLHKNGAISGDGAVAFGADLKRLQALAQSFAPPAPVTQGTVVAVAPNNSLDDGRADGSLEFSHPANSSATDVKGDIKLSRLSSGRALLNENADVPFTAHVPDDFASAQASLDLVSSFGTVSAKDLQLILSATVDGKTTTPSIFDQLKSAHLIGKDLDLKKLDALAKAFSPPASATPGAPTAAAGASDTPTVGLPPKPVPPMEVTSGMANFDLAVARNGQSTGVTVSNFQIANLGISRGVGHYQWTRDITVKAYLAIATLADATGKAGLMDLIQSINVDSLDGQFGVATVALAAPIVIKDFGKDEPSYSGGINVNGQLADISRVLEALQGTAPGSLPYAGALALSNKFSTQKNRIIVNQDGGISNFQVFDKTGATPVFSEPQVTLNNQLAVNMKNKAIIMDGNGVNIAMTGSKALGLKVTGALRDWEKARTFDNVKIGLDYDLASLWNIIRPMMSQEQQASLADLKIAGKYHRDFSMTGSLPAGPAFNEAVKSLVTSGDLTIDEFDHNGLIVQKLDVPIDLKNGIARVAYTGKPAGQDMPQAATCNGGALDIGGAVVDLTGDAPRLTMPKGKKILADVNINKILNKTALKSLPFLASADDATGTMTLTADHCDRLPLSDLMTQQVASNDGSAAFTIDMSNVTIVGGTVAEVLQFAGLNLGKANVKGGKVALSGGTVTSDIALLFGAKADQSIGFKGDTILSNNTLRNYGVNIGAMFLEKRFPGAAKILPAGLTASLTGPAARPKLDIMGAIQANAPQLITGGLGNLLGGKSNKPSGDGTTTQPAPDQNPIDILGGLLGGKKKNAVMTRAWTVEARSTMRAESRNGV